MATKIIRKEIPTKEIIGIQDVFNRFQTAHNQDEYMKEIEELAMSIKEQGLLQPIVVYKEAANKYVLLAGARRFTAITKFLKWDKIPATILPEKNPLTTISENIQRVDLTPLEKGEWIVLGIKYYQEEKGIAKKEDAMKELCKQLGKKPRTLYDWERLATTATPQQKKEIKSGSKTSTQVLKENTSKGKGGRKGTAKKTLDTKGKEIKKAGNAFNTLCDKITDKITYIGENAIEYKENKQVVKNLERILEYARLALEQIEA